MKNRVLLFCGCFLFLFCITSCACLSKATVSTSAMNNQLSEGNPDESCPTDNEFTEGQMETSLPDAENDLKKDNEVVNNYKLIVIGQDITQGNYLNFNSDPRYAALPFTAVMKALGAKIEWKSLSIAEITFNGEKYLLDTQAVSLAKEGSSSNYIIPTPGSKVYYQIAGKELVLDHITVRTVADIMGIKLSIEVDYQNNTVEINYRT